MYKPAEFTAVQEERARLNGLLAYIKEENERLAQVDKQNEQDIKTFEDCRGLRSGFQVRYFLD